MNPINAHQLQAHVDDRRRELVDGLAAARATPLRIPGLRDLMARLRRHAPSAPAPASTPATLGQTAEVGA